MLYRPKSFNLANRLSFLLIISILVMVASLQWYFDAFLAQKYREQAQQRINYTLDHFTTRVALIKKELREGVLFIQDDESFIASIELINNYQDTQNYPAILLDEEKKKIAQQLLYRVKLSLNSEIVAYDHNHDPIAYVTKTPKGYELNVISYTHGKPICLSRYENQTTYLPKPYTPRVAPPHSNAPISYKTHANTLTIQANQSFKDPKTHQNLVSITLAYTMGSAYFSSLAEGGDVHLFGSTDPRYNPATLQTPRADQPYLGSIAMPTPTPFYVVAQLNNHFLDTALRENRQTFLLLVITIAFIALAVSHYILNHTLARPLDTLMRQIQKIDQHDYTHSPIVHTNDEFQTLSHELNALAQTIDKREKALQASQHQLEHRSNTDTLTGLANRRLFYASLERAITLAQHHNTTLAVIFLDLDDFKAINDTLGHDIGDELLQNVALRLTQALPQKTLLARMGGDEFTLLIEDFSDISSLLNLAQTLVHLFNTPFELAENTIFITASIGISLFPKDGENLVSLIKYADLALYQSKNKGRNTFSFFSTDLAIHLQKHNDHLHALKTAIETKHEFYLLYQPKVSPYTGKIMGVEALIRWESSTLGMVYPDRFIPLAEESGLIIPLGEWILHQACHDFVHLMDEGYCLKHISVNVSSLQLHKSDMLQTLENVITTTGIAPQQLELEITESYLATEQHKALQTLQALRTKGVDIAIDDFGTGYSSLSYLRKLPITRLKIDKSFVDDLPFSSESVAVVNAIIALAKTFNLALTAEGVETQAQLNFLKEHQCDEIQGYYYSKPLPLKAFKAFIAEHS